MEDISFHAPERAGETYTIDKEVHLLPLFHNEEHFYGFSLGVDVCSSEITFVCVAICRVCSGQLETF